MKIKHSRDYRELRRKEYPSIGDQLDVMYKYFSKIQERGEELPIEIVEWLENIEEIKTKYKKN